MGFNNFSYVIIARIYYYYYYNGHGGTTKPPPRGRVGWFYGSWRVVQVQIYFHYSIIIFLIFFLLYHLALSSSTSSSTASFFLSENDHNKITHNTDTAVFMPATSILFLFFFLSSHAKERMVGGNNKSRGSNRTRYPWIRL